MAYVSMTDLFPPDLSGKRYYGPGSSGATPPPGVNLMSHLTPAPPPPPPPPTPWRPVTSVAAALNPQSLQAQNTYYAQQMEKNWTPQQAAAQPVYQEYQRQQMQAELDRLRNQASAQETYEYTRRLAEAQARAAEQQRLQAEAQRRAQEEAEARRRAQEEAAARARAQQEAEYLRQVGAMQAEQIAQQQAALQQAQFQAQQAQLQAQQAQFQAQQAAQQQQFVQQPPVQQHASYDDEEAPEDGWSNNDMLLAASGVALVGALGYWLYKRSSRAKGPHENRLAERAA